MTTDNTPQLPDIGYLFHYPDLDHPKEKFRLDIFLSSQPTEKHFDVHKVTLPALTDHGPVNSLEIFHPWELKNQFRVCAGQLSMVDRKGVKEVGFTFGGEMKISRQDFQTISSLVSPAPILHLTDGPRVKNSFVEEVEILLAEHRAKYHDQEKYLTRLCGADPLDLYQACLLEEKNKIENLFSKTDNYDELLEYLHSEELRLHKAGLLVHPSPTLADIFGESDSQ